MTDLTKEIMPNCDRTRKRGPDAQEGTDMQSHGTQETHARCRSNWNEVYYTNCPLVSASNVDQELGWTKEEYKKIGVKYAFLRSRAENNWYPHYIHNLDNLIRFGGLFPPIHVQADIRRTRLLGVTHAPREGGCMMVRSRDDIYRMIDLKGKKIGLSQEPEHHQERLVAHPGGAGHRADAPDERHDPRRRPDRRVPLPGRLVRQARDDGPADGERRRSCGSSATTSATWPSGRWRRRCEKGIIDAIYTQTGPLPAPSGGDGQVQGHRGPVPVPGLDAAGGQHPRRHHLHRRDGREAPRARRHVHEGHDQGGALGQRAQARRGGDPRQADLLPGRRGTRTGASSTSTWCPTCRRRTWSPSRSARTSC